MTLPQEQQCAGGEGTLRTTGLGSNPSPASASHQKHNSRPVLVLPLECGPESLLCALADDSAQCHAILTLASPACVWCPTLLPEGPRSGPVFSAAPDPACTDPSSCLRHLVPKLSGVRLSMHSPSVALHVVHPSGDRAVIIVCILQMKKLRHGNVKHLAEVTPCEVELGCKS